MRIHDARQIAAEAGIMADELDLHGSVMAKASPLHSTGDAHTRLRARGCRNLLGAPASSYHGRHLGVQGMRVLFVCALASAASLQLACVWACVLPTGHIFAPTAGADKQNPAPAWRPAQRQETRPCCLALPRSFLPIGDARCRLRSKACARRAPEIYLRARPRPTAWWQVTTCWSRA